MVPHQYALVLCPDSGLHYFSDEHRVVAFGHLSHNSAFPPCWGVHQQWATGFLTRLELLPPDGVAFPSVGLEEVEGKVQLVLAQNVDRKDTGVLDVVVESALTPTATNGGEKEV